MINGSNFTVSVRDCPVCSSVSECVVESRHGFDWLCKECRLALDDIDRRHTLVTAYLGAVNKDALEVAADALECAGLYGQLARQQCGVILPLEVHKSGAGFYIGTYDYSESGGPYTRESEEYFKTKESATAALTSGLWTQRLEL